MIGRQIRKWRDAIGLFNTQRQTGECASHSVAVDMNPLEQEIKELIINNGPVSIADYMTLCLMHPKYGYYTSGSPIGGQQSGDFITAPEVSQMFGELLGVWCMQMWQQLGSPSPFNLVEIGPGRGTLMRDLLRAGKALPGFLSAADVYRVEISDTLAAEQDALLADTGVETKRMRELDEIPHQPTLIIANELLDALPLRQWVNVGDNWHERAIGLEGDKLAFALKPNLLDVSELPTGWKNEPDGMIFETAPGREGYIASVAEFIAEHAGAALFIDYGHVEPGFGDTFQAVQNHRYGDVLKDQGQCDLTSHVCFAPLVETVRRAGCAAPEPVDQGDFLLRLGLLERAGQLGADGDTELQNGLHQDVERLAGPEQMGNLFKVMAFGKLPKAEIVWPGVE